MSVLKVTCVARSESGPEGHVRGIGGDGFYHTADEAVNAISSRAHQYWTEIDGQSVWLEAGHQADGKPYLKAEGDQGPANKLLTLEDCQFAAEEESNGEENLAQLMSRGDDGKDAITYTAERMAVRTVLRMLVLNRYGRDQARLDRNRDDAVRRLCAAIENMDIDDDDARDQLTEAVTREIHFYFAAPPRQPGT